MHPASLCPLTIAKRCKLLLSSTLLAYNCFAAAIELNETIPGENLKVAAWWSYVKQDLKMHAYMFAYTAQPLVGFVNEGLPLHQQQPAQRLHKCNAKKACGKKEVEIRLPSQF